MSAEVTLQTYLGKLGLLYQENEITQSLSKMDAWIPTTSIDLVRWFKGKSVCHISQMT